MGGPELYHEYRPHEAVSLLGPADQARSLCGGPWILLPNHVLCLAAVGTPPGPSHFPSASRFCWAADRPYRSTGHRGQEQGLSDRWDEFLPREVRAGRERDLPIHLFARGTGQDTYRYLGHLGPSSSWRSGSPGRNFGEAYFELSPPLPSRIWTELGGLRLQDGDHSSLTRLGGPLPVEERLDILRRTAESWHGPIGPDDGLPEGELADCRLPFPLRWWYALAGRRPGLVDGFNHLLGPRLLSPVGDGLVLFLSEPQGGYGWATLPEGEDPPVWGSFDRDGPWVNEGMSLSEFLLQSCLFEAVNTTAPYQASARVDAAGLERLSLVAPPLPLAPWHWPVYPTAFHAGGSAFLLVMGERFREASQSRSFSVLVGARTEHPLRRLACLLYGGWDRLDWSPLGVEPAWLTWQDAAVPRIARSIREEHRFSDLPVLADALEEAGGSEAELLDHCRRPVPHTVGCYLVDALLGVGPERGPRAWGSPDFDATDIPF